MLTNSYKLLQTPIPWRGCCVRLDVEPGTTFAAPGRQNRRSRLDAQKCKGLKERFAASASALNLAASRPTYPLPKTGHFLRREADKFLGKRLESKPKRIWPFCTPLKKFWGSDKTFLKFGNSVVEPVTTFVAPGRRNRHSRLDAQKCPVT